jgi:hypothetical protein
MDFELSMGQPHRLQASMTNETELEIVDLIIA